MTNERDPLSETYLLGVRVLEVADELGEYAGKVLAGLGADVVKVEPPSGEKTRGYGPFLDDEPDPERSLHFWHYNHGKRGIVIDLDSEEGQNTFLSLARAADVVLDSRSQGYLDERGVGYRVLSKLNPALIYARITPFGADGPWASYKGSDLIHLALGGVVMNCGYDPDPFGHYDTEPVAPQMWHAYHIAGEMCVIAILGALMYRIRSGKGQYVVTNVHDAVSKNTETDLPDWVFLRQPHYRLTSRHSMTSATGPALSMTKDGRYLLPYRTYLKGAPGPWDGTVRILGRYGMQEDLEDPKYSDEDFRYAKESTDRIAMLTDKLVGRLLYDRDLWKEGQAEGLPWAPIRKPEENAADEHWQMRGAVAEVEHEDLGRSFTYVGAKWYSPDAKWRIGPRAPHLGEHTATVLSEWEAAPRPLPKSVLTPKDRQMPKLSRRGKPFALEGVRVIDLSWMLASAGAGRFLAALGAEVIKVEHGSHWDAMRFSLGQLPNGGRVERDAAKGPIPTPQSENPNRGGSFMEINAGKLGVSLNLKHEESRRILEDLIRDADMVVEGFSPGAFEKMGFGYERLKELNPQIIYVQQSGFGQYGKYGRARTYGPTAQAFTGLTDMSGLPEPFPPAGIGYSYLDWFGAYNMANAMLAALYRRELTGRGCWIDASQGETGLYLTGTAILDSSANGRQWQRYGNRSPYKQAAPHGVYRVKGEDRWIAIAAFDDDEWQATARTLGHPEWVDDPRFRSLDDRIAHHRELDRLFTAETSQWDGFELMARLQSAGAPAGVCQTAQDRYESDPQLRHLKWLVELEQPTLGCWPVKELPFTMSVTPPYIGGPYDHSGPDYGQHNELIYLQRLGISPERYAQLQSEGAF